MQAKLWELIIWDDAGEVFVANCDCDAMRSLPSSAAKRVHPTAEFSLAPKTQECQARRNGQCG